MCRHERSRDDCSHQCGAAIDSFAGVDEDATMRGWVGEVNARQRWEGRSGVANRRVHAPIRSVHQQQLPSADDSDHD